MDGKRDEKNKYRVRINYIDATDVYKRQVFPVKDCLPICFFNQQVYLCPVCRRPFKLTLKPGAPPGKALA